MSPIFRISHILRCLLLTGAAVIMLHACKIREDNASRPPSARSIREDSNCYHNGKLKPGERSAIYPFNKADEIRVISFHSRLEKAPISNDSIISRNVIESISLSPSQADRLTDVLYNYNYSKRSNAHSVSVTACYNPRHAIVFLDYKGKVLSYIELCLECNRFESALPAESVGVFCDGKYKLLEEFFVSIGIKHFTDIPY